MRRNEGFSFSVFLIIMIILFLIASKGGNFHVYLEYGGEVSAEKKSWWGLKSEFYQLKVIKGEWHARKIAENYFFQSTQKVKGEWFYVDLEGPPEETYVDR